MEFSVGVRAFVIGLSQTSAFFFSFLKRHSWAHGIGHCIYSFKIVRLFRIFSANDNSKIRCASSI